MKVNEIIEQCNELLEDETYYLQTIELTKDEVKVLLEETKRLHSIINEARELVKNECWGDNNSKCVEDLIYHKCDELLEILDKGSDKE